MGNEEINIDILLNNDIICKGLSPELMEGILPVRMCYGCNKYLKKDNCYYNQQCIKYIGIIKEKLRKERLEKELQKAGMMARE